MKARDVLFAVSLLMLAALAFSPGNAAACEGGYAAGSCRAADLPDQADQVVFQDYEASDPTCVCSVDQGLLNIFGEEQETCTTT